MRFQYDPVKVGVGIFLLILLSVITVVAGFWNVLTPREKATVAIGGVGALGTATLALATFWTIKQNEKTLQDLEKERRKAVILDILAEVIDPIIGKAEESRKRLATGQNVWKRNTSTSNMDDLSIPLPPTYQDIEVSVWEEFEEDYPDIYERCGNWWNQINDLSDAAKELAEVLYDAEEYDKISDKDKAVKMIMNATRYASSADPPVRDVEAYRRMMYRNYPEEHHQYWRNQWQLFKLVKEVRSEAIERKRELQAEYGISNREIAEYQNVS